MPWGVVAGAVISAGAGAAEDSASASAQKKAQAPLAAAQNDLYSQAENIAATPYTPYTGQQVAGLTANQQQAITQANNEVTNNEAQADIGNAEQQAAFIGGNTWNAATASKYMNPYTQDVTNVALNQENQAYGAQENSNNAAAASQGAFGGDRAALTDVATTGQHLQAQGNIEAEGMANAYANAQSAWQNDNQRAATAASAYEAAGNDITNMNASQIKDLLATGGTEQTTQQLGLTTNYNNYLDQRAWPTNQLSALESAAGRTPTAAAVQPVNIATDVLGASSALAGYMGSNGTTSNNAALSSQLNNWDNNTLSSSEINPGSNVSISGETTPSDDQLFADQSSNSGDISNLLGSGGDL